jgi:hypothetical protein
MKLGRSRAPTPNLHRESCALMSEEYRLHLQKPPDPKKVWFFRLDPPLA